mmetsp:Transcript_19964/g.50334  ORF Transcript_19964/g.50334 Transcript_19964/m.50334 type:complete len:102 (+) Transcript_19964:400-705(+)
MKRRELQEHSAAPLQKERAIDEAEDKAVEQSRFRLSRSGKTPRAAVRKEKRSTATSSTSSTSIANLYKLCSWVGSSYYNGRPRKLYFGGVGVGTVYIATAY